MESADLAFFTSGELIRELMNRQTFLGVVIESEADYRQQNWGQERMFKVHMNGNLSAEQAARLLEVVAENVRAESYKDAEEA